MALLMFIELHAHLSLITNAEGHTNLKMYYINADTNILVQKSIFIQTNVLPQVKLYYKPSICCSVSKTSYQMG